MRRAPVDGQRPPAVDAARLGLAPSPQWTVADEGGRLVASAGADLRYAFPDVTPAVAAEVASAWDAGDVDRRDLSTGAGEVFDQLAGLGALRPAAPPAPPAVTVRFVHRPVPALAALASGGPGPAVVVLVRTDGALAELAAAAPGDTPHLVVDLAYHHTVSLGPLVVPGQTACAACLAARVAARWGDPRPPPAPAASGAEVAAALVAHEVGKVADGTSLLVNRTVAVDLSSWRTVDETVLRRPGCPTCGSTRTGRVPLPWAP